MESRAKLAGHPIHQVLVVFPLGLLATAVIFDTLAFIRDNPLFHEVAFWMMVSGVLGGLAAAVFGFTDWLAIPPGTRAKTVGAIHGLGNVVVVALFLISVVLRKDTPLNPSGEALLCSYLGFLIAPVTAWLGGELVVRLGVGVYDDANLDAPSSLHCPVSAGAGSDQTKRGTSTEHPVH
jgi:uncharacterized membrane protein